MKRKAYLYQRFSSSRQSGNSSIFRQTEAQTAWLRSHPEVEVVDTLNDSGLSGYKGDHLKKGELGKLVAAAEEGKIESGSLILVEQFSRLSRLNQTETAQLVDKIWNAGITIVTVRDGTEYSPKDREDLSHKLRLVIEIDKAHSDSVWRSEKIKASYAARFKSASESCTPPNIRKKYWFAKDGTVNEYATAVREMFDLYLEGYGGGTILNKLRVKYPSHKKLQTMDPGGIIKTITDTKCIGLYDNQKVYEPVIDEVTFYKAQAIYQSKSLVNPRKKRVWPLQGLLKCGHCGSGMGLQHSKGKLPVVRCSNKRRRGKGIDGCNSKSTFPYIVADHFLNFHAEKYIIGKLSNKEKTEDTQKKLREVNSKLSNFNRAFTEASDTYRELSNNGKRTATVLKLISETEEKIYNFESLKLEYDGIINASESFLVSKNVLELRQNQEEYNLEMRKQGVQFVIESGSISYSDIVKLKYTGFVRKEKKYFYQLNGKSGFISSEGVTAESLLKSPTISENQKQALEHLNDAIVEMSTSNGATSAEAGLKIIAKHMDKLGNDKRCKSKKH